MSITRFSLTETLYIELGYFALLHVSGQCVDPCAVLGKFAYVEFTSMNILI